MWFYWFLFDSYGSPRVYFVTLLALGPTAAIRFLCDKLTISISFGYQMLILFLVILCLQAAMFGHIKATLYLEHPKKIKIFYKDKSEEKYNFVRRISSGIIVYKKNTLSIISADQVTKISQGEFSANTYSTACKLIKVCLR